MKTLTCVLLLALSSHAQGDSTSITLAATRLKASTRISKKTKYVSCWDRKNKLTGSRLVRSPVLVSPDESRRAFVEVEATAFQPKDSNKYIGPLCENTSRLFFAVNGKSQYTIEFSQSQEDFSDGNSLTLVDWSSDGTRLLLERTQWKYESEGDYTDFVIFDASSKNVSHPDVESAIATSYGKDCGSENSVLGFTHEGKVVLALTPLTEDIALMNGAKSCVARKTLLALDINNGAVVNMVPLSGDVKIVQNGKFIVPKPQP